MREYLRSGADKFLCCHTEIEAAAQTISPSYSTLTPGKPVVALTPKSQVQGWVATTIPVFNPIWTYLLQITQLCHLCCVDKKEEKKPTNKQTNKQTKKTPPKLVYCDIFRPVTAVAMQFILLPGQKVRCIYENMTTMKNIHQHWCKDFRLTSLLQVIS